MATSPGRPIPTLSATRASKKPRARRGSSKTSVVEVSTWRIDSSHHSRPRGRRGKRRRDRRHPAVEEGLDVARARAGRRWLAGGGSVTGCEAVGELAEAMPGPAGLALHPLVAVQPHLCRIGEVAADLDERRARTPVENVEVVGADAALLPEELQRPRPPAWSPGSGAEQTRWNSSATTIATTPNRPSRSAASMYGRT